MRVGLAAHTRVVLQKPTITENEIGEEEITWSDVVTLSAERQEEAGSEVIRAGRLEADQAVVWRMHFREDITTDWRMKAGEKVYNIHSIREVRPRRELELVTSLEDNA